MFCSSDSTLFLSTSLGKHPTPAWRQLKLTYNLFCPWACFRGRTGYGIIDWLENATRSIKVIEWILFSSFSRYSRAARYSNLLAKNVHDHLVKSTYLPTPSYYYPASSPKFPIACPVIRMQQTVTVIIASKARKSTSSWVSVSNFWSSNSINSQVESVSSYSMQPLTVVPSSLRALYQAKIIQRRKGLLYP